MSVKVPMQAPTNWPFNSPVIPGHLMPSGNSYRTDANGQIQALQQDVGSLAGYGFTIVGSFPSAGTLTGTESTIVSRSGVSLESTTQAVANLASGGGGVANPTATIGLSAVNGSASSAIRSDGAPALGQDIVPTWTGAHIFTKKVALTPVARGAQSAAGTLTLDFATGNNFTATFGAGNLTIANPTNVAAGQSGLLALTQDSVGGRTVSWGGNWKFSGATAPTLTVTGDSVDLISFVAVSATVIVATLAVADYR